MKALLYQRNLIETLPMDLAAIFTLMILLTMGIDSVAFESSTSEQSPNKSHLNWYGEHAEVKLIREEDADGEALRTYSLSTTLRLRQGQHQAVLTSENMRFPRLRTQHLLFDGLFALTMSEVQQASARGDKIYDGAFNWGQGIDCRCFETGEKWPYVWTRDISYSLYLGLPMLDVTRSLESLKFKVSQSRVNPPFLGSQIVQDTGSGGSWPVSTDRVVWALAGQEIMEYLQGSELSQFEDEYIKTMKNTLEMDRIAIWDPLDGLYRGESSFLDWREQSYPRWVQNNVVFIGESKSLSTNALHYIALNNLSLLLEKKGQLDQSRKFASWADQLKMAINQEFWLPREQTYGALKWAQPVGIVSPRMDVLGLALVLLHDIASADRAQKVMAQYPHSTQGAPVIWPQVPDIPIYHNRAIWPFVSSLWMLAAKKHNHSSIVHHNLMTLVRGTALNLSNMENFEFLTLANFYADGNFSGPVVNSARQLWSVAGYMAGVVKGLFGVTFKNDILEMDPFIAETTRRELFEESKDLELRGIVVKGKIFDIRLVFPTQKAALQGSYKKQLILLNGRKIFGNKVKLEEFKESQRNQLVVYLGAFDSSPTPWTLLPDHRPPLSETVVNSLWAPEEPLVSSLEFQKDGEHLRIVSVEKRNLDYVIYRNGEYVARIPRQSNTTEWVDNQVPDNRGDLYCYSVFSVDRDFNLWSFPSQPKCIAAKNRALHFHRFSPENGQLKSLDNARLSQKHGRLHFENWGLPGQELLISGFTPSVSGTYSLTWEYGNAHAPISTGVTAGVKKLVIQEKGSQQTVSTLVFFFPQLNSWDNWGQSNRQNVELKANGNYDFYLVDLFNMTYLDHFKLYTANPGGYEGPLNRVNISHLEMWLEHH